MIPAEKADRDLLAFRRCDNKLAAELGIGTGSAAWLAD
jgi:hypothetical protein